MDTVQINIEKPNEEELVELATEILKTVGFVRLTDLFYLTIGKYPESSCAIYWTHYPRTRRGCTPHFAINIKKQPGVKTWTSDNDVLLQYVGK